MVWVVYKKLSRTVFCKWTCSSDPRCQDVTIKRDRDAMKAGYLAYLEFNEEHHDHFEREIPADMHRLIMSPTGLKDHRWPMYPSILIPHSTTTPVAQSGSGVTQSVSNATAVSMKRKEHPDEAESDRRVKSKTTELPDSTNYPGDQADTMMEGGNPSANTDMNIEALFEEPGSTSAGMDIDNPTPLPAYPPELYYGCDHFLGEHVIWTSD